MTRFISPVTFLIVVCSHHIAAGEGDWIQLACDTQTDAWQVDQTVWQVGENVELDPHDPTRLIVRSGSGVLANLSNDHSPRSNLTSTQDFGDVEVHVEFLIPRGSNGGVKLHGLYEIQIFDSYGVESPTASDCGGVYPRAELEPRYRTIDEGFPPRVNAAKPAGQWQSLDIEFQAPRFGPDGRKTENARFVKVVLNDQVIHEDVELKWPTGHAWRSRTEVARGPLFLQGDHGPIAYRNVQVRQNSTACCQGYTTSSAQPNLDRVTTPQIEVGALQALQLPDVRILAVEHLDGEYDSHVGTEERTFAGIAGSNGDTVPHVRVDGVIGGTVHFELLLPDQWNGRFVMGGGGGFVGRVINWARFTVNHGFVTVGTDTGHQSPSVMNGEWALNDLEAQLNFGYLAVHRTAEVAKAITRAYYGNSPEYSYFVGCSRGGGQALMEAQRYPDDFDGIVSAAPALNWPGFTSAALNATQHLYPDASDLATPILSRRDLERLHAEVLEQCDAIDGVDDGLLDDPRMCEFDLSRVEGLTPAQRNAIRAVYDGPTNDQGSIFPGIPLGAEGHPSGWFYWITGPLPPALIEQQKYPSVAYALGTEFYKYFVFNDPDWDYTNYDFNNWERDTALLGTFLNATDPDLSDFKNRNGKLILWHGWSDSILTAYATIDYYEEVERRDPDLRDFARLYLLPGVMHCRGGRGPDSIDWLSAIVDWVEHDKPPERLIATKYDEQGAVVITRPLHPYPLRAVYRGSGSTNDAENFILHQSNPVIADEYLSHD